MKKVIITSLVLAMTLVPAGLNAADKPLKKSVSWEQFNMHNVMLPQIGEIKTIQSDGSGNSYWSVGCETLDRDYADFKKYKHLFHDLGVGYARVQSGWEKTEQEKGVYDYAWLDEIVDGLLEQGVIPWLSLSYGNKIYGSSRDHIETMVAKDNMKVWLKYVETTVQRYSAKGIHVYEIWNEPNLRDRKCQYFPELLWRTAEQIRKVDPQSEILAIGLSGMGPSYVKKCLDELKRKGKIDCIDKISYHAYYRNPDEVVANADSLKALCKQYSDKLDVIQGEAGCPSQLEYTHAMRDLPWTEYKQAKWDARRMATDFSLGIHSSIFTMVDLRYTNMLQSFGLVRMNLLSEPQYLRPSYYTVQHMCSILTTDIKPNLSVTCNAETQKEVRVVGLEKEGKIVGAMLWYCGEMPTDELEKEIVNVTLYGLNLVHPAYIDAITGKVYDLGSCVLSGGNFAGRLKLTRLPMWDAPIIILNKDCINLK